MSGSGIVEMDVHGLNVEQAKNAVDRQLETADSGVYRIRVIHGYHGGTGIKRMITEEYGYGRDSRVKRMQDGGNPGITELILREY